MVERMKRNPFNAVVVELVSVGWCAINQSIAVASLLACFTPKKAKQGRGKNGAGSSSRRVEFLPEPTLERENYTGTPIPNRQLSKPHAVKSLLSLYPITTIGTTATTAKTAIKRLLWDVSFQKRWILGTEGRR